MVDGFCEPFMFLTGYMKYGCCRVEDGMRWFYFYLLCRLLVVLWIATFLIGITVYSIHKCSNVVDHDIQLNFKNRLYGLRNDLRRVCLISYS